jgi:multidrug efflux pump subunit AcrA (membrane-fusion protein)
VENRFVVQGDTLFSIRRKGLKSEQIYRAPRDGYVRNLKSEAQKTLVYSGEMILEIQTESDLVVKCYLSGDKITSLQPEQNVEFQIHTAQQKRDKSFAGKVTDILPDISRKDKAAIFEVRCSIDNPVGNDLHASELKPGMALLARFRLARRSAFDIILKDVEPVNRDPS